MTEIAMRQDNADLTPARPTAPAAVPQPAASALLLWAQEAHQASIIAEKLAKTSFVPASLRGKPADITATILAGQELGLQPMASLRSVDVIQGTPALRAHAMRGLVQSHGHQIQLVESTETLCRMRGRRKGDDAWQEVVWTIERAQRLGLTGKDQWKKQPQTMLVARATGELCRLIASDALHAMPYAAEELDGDDRGLAVSVAPRVTLAELAAQVANAPQVGGRQPVQVPAPVSAPPTEPAAPADDAPLASDEQRAAMAGLWSELGFGGDDNHPQRMQITAKILGLPEPVESSDELTAGEAEQVLAALRAKLAEREGAPA